MSSRYQKTLDFLFSQLPMFQRQGATAIKKDLHNTQALLDHLGKPHLEFPSIHIAGTNGKGSVSHLLSSVLQEAGYKVGLYTSPHLQDFRERIKIAGNPCTKQQVVNFVEQLKDEILKIRPSFFEITVAMAFEIFRKEQVDIAVVETGLGGRLDSTNVLSPILSVITNISFDHQAFLGNSLEEIAREKAGIIKANTPVVIGPMKTELQDLFKNFAEKRSSELITCMDSQEVHDYPSDLKASYQKANRQTTLRVITQLRKQGWHLEDIVIKRGFQNTIVNTGFYGRWQEIDFRGKRCILDAAHNENGIEAALNELKRISFDRLHIVFGTVQEKDLNPLLIQLPKEAHYYLCAAQVPRALSTKALRIIFDDFDLKNSCYKSSTFAFEQAVKNCGEQDLVLVLGSFFHIAEILAFIDS